MSETSLDIPTAIARFFDQVATGAIEIYNECSLQFELGIFLRSACSDTCRVQFERPVGFFALDRPKFVKKEIDLALFTPDPQQRIAIELKFPRQGQHPEQMFKFCQDIWFMEQLVASGFTAGYFLAVADDRLFYEGSSEGIYSYFRRGAPLHGTIRKPTGKRDEIVELCGNYRVDWKDAGPVRYFCLQAA